MWTKRQQIEQAMLEIGLGQDFDIEANEFEAALRSLDSMMATWNGKGIRVGYALPSSPDESNLDDDSGVLDFANEAVYLNLGIRIAPRYGKTVSQDTRIAAKQAYDVLLSRAVFPTPQPMPNTMPIGAGNRTWGQRRFYPTPPEVLDAGADDPLTI